MSPMVPADALALARSIGDRVVVVTDPKSMFGGITVDGIVAGVDIMGRVALAASSVNGITVKVPVPDIVSWRIAA